MSLRTSDFEFELPGDLIAQEPSATRGHSRLLVVAEALRDATFVDLVDLVPPGDLLVLNTTRVRHARFLGARASGAPAEVLLLHPASSGNWIAIGKPGSALRPGKRIAIEINQTIVPRSAHTGTVLHSGDCVEIVHAIGGG